MNSFFKKYTLMFFLIGSSSMLLSQVVRKEIKSTKIAGLTCKYSARIEGEDTTFNVFCAFKNMKYKHINDIGSIYIGDSSALNLKISELESCIPYLDEKGVSYSIGDFKIYDFSDLIFIYDESKYTTLKKDEVAELITWLKSVQWGSWSKE